MPSVLEELYYGNIRPDSRFYGQESRFVKAAKLKQVISEKLTTALNESEKELFDKYLDAQSEMDDITRYDIFTYALKFGVLLMTEVFCGMDEVTGYGSMEV